MNDDVKTIGTDAYKQLELQRLKEMDKKLTEVLDIPKGRKDDSDKLRYDLLDPEFIEGIVKILSFGARKYDPNNWRQLINNDGYDRCYAALMRHLSEWRKGNKIDNESGLSHLFHAACNLYFLEYFDRNSNK